MLILQTEVENKAFNKALFIVHQNNEVLINNGLEIERLIKCNILRLLVEVFFSVFCTLSLFT